MIAPYARYRPKIHATAFVAPSADVIGRVSVARGASIWFGSVLRGDIQEIRVGRDSNIQDQCMLHVEKTHPCVVKERVTVGHQVALHGCVIEDAALIGIGARILTGARVGRHSIIGAGAVVLENAVIPPGSLAVGVPAKVVRKLTAAEIRSLEHSARKYVRLAREYREAPDMIAATRELVPLKDLGMIFK